MSTQVNKASCVLQNGLRTFRSRPTCTRSQSRRSPLQTLSRQRRHIATASSQLQEMEVEGNSSPRWQQTPAGMKNPIQAKPRLRERMAFPVNNDPKKLDDMYARFLGRDGPRMLSDEAKWLAVTHKSFDHGRRGFNDRLSFLGKRVFELQVSLGLLNVSDSSTFRKEYPDPHGRTPFSHPALASAESLLGGSRAHLTHPKQITKLSEGYGVPQVVRWVPKNSDALAASGCDAVYTQAVFAILGALALEQGGAVANRIAIERVLQPLGLRRGMP